MVLRNDPEGNEDGTEIADTTDGLNGNGYKTSRGGQFKNTSVFSILKKRKIIEERINKP